MNLRSDQQAALRKLIGSDQLLKSMLHHAAPRQETCPAKPEVRLTSDGWEIWGGEITEKLPVHVDFAYEATRFDQRVLDETRKLCGQLRFAAKRDRVAQEILEDLRAGLARARAMKEAHENAG